MSNSWPDDVPQTLWNYGSLKVQSIPQIPMMGTQVSQQFVVAFVLGCVFIGYFAWSRFNSKQPGAPDFRYRVMKEVDVSDLGGAAALRQAYLIYLTTLIFLYTAMTFFGKLITETVNALNVVGIQVDGSSLEFDNPQWPLMLAFGFAGLAPLLPQLRAAEVWLFRRAYRAVGIPVRIHETTRNLVSLLNAASSPVPSSGNGKGSKDSDKDHLLNDTDKDLNERLSDIRDRVATIWDNDNSDPRSTKTGQSQMLLAQLELLVAWSRGGRGAWPGAEVSNAVRVMEREVANEADEFLDGLYKRAGEGQQTSAAAAARRKKYLADAFGKARELRDELAAILAVYVERDPSYVGRQASEDAPIREKSLQKLLSKADLPNLAGTGPELGVLICILFAVPIYAILAWQELHPLLSQRVTPGLGVVVATAGLETLRLMSIFWLPLLAAFGLRQYYYDEGIWIARASDDRSAYAEQRLAIISLTFVVSAICLSGVATLWAFLVAKDVSVFQALLVGGAPPFILYYPSMAFVTIPLVWLSLMAADARAERRSGVSQGVWSALLVVSVHASHIAFWYGGSRRCTDTAPFLTDLLAGGCFRHYGGLDFIVMPVLAFLAAVVFGNPRPASLALRRQRLLRRGGALKAAILLAALVPTLVDAPAAQAQAAAGKQEVTIGFRADVEPFSYKVNSDVSGRNGNQPLYKGFLADLCYWIFDGSDFSVIENEVTALNRFDELRKRKIDVLCDPVTMRFSDEVRTRSGTFSPIVFATGISYLLRRQRGPRNSVYIGYVENSTAAKVVVDLCMVDALGLVPPDERGELAIMCEIAALSRRIEALSGRIASLFADAPGSVPRDWSVLLEDWEIYQRDWEKAKRDWDAALDGVELAVKAEKVSIASRQRKARPPKKETLKNSLTMWSETVTHVEACREDGTCDPETIARKLGDRCDDLEVKKDNSQWSRTVYRFCPLPTHADLIDWFCQPRPGEDLPTMAYLGDREIILGKLQTWNAQHIARCGVENENGADDLTYEPYAIMLARPSPEEGPEELLRRQAITDLVQRRIYEFFSFGSLARAKFDTYFLGPRKDRQMSTALAYLFILNGVEDERRFTYPIDEATATD